MKHAQTMSLLLLGLTATSIAGAGVIRLKVAEFDPALGLPEFAGSLGHESPGVGNRLNFLVQLDGVATTGDQRLLERQGLRVLGYIPDGTWIVRGTTTQVSRVREIGRTMWSGELMPAYKLSTDMGLRSLTSAERQFEQSVGLYTAVVTLFDGDLPESAATFASSTGAEVVEVSKAGPYYNLQVKGSLHQLRQLAKHVSVSFIEEAGEATLRNDITRWVIQSNTSNVNTVWDKGIKGLGQVGGLIDGALYTSHNSFRDATNNTPGPNHRKVVYYSGSSGSDSHGTHTAGTLAGDQFPLTGQTFRNGMAYQARIAFTNLSSVSSSNLYSKFQGAMGAGATDHSNSWGDDGTTSYTSWCRAIDQFSWDFEDQVVAFAVTNTTTLKTPENAKSCLAVGATSQAPSQQNHATGGTGPTNDGRRKPEVYAPGAGIWSSQSGTTSGWVSFTGTSMACPAVTGGCLLIRQYFRDGWFHDGTARPGKGMMPSGALVRAMIMNCSVDMTGVSGYPSNREGWGRILLDNSLYFKGDQRKLFFSDQRNASGLVTGNLKKHFLRVTDSGVPLRVTLTFTDFPAQALANPAYINNLDLEVIAPDGTVYLGNDINTSTGNSKTGGVADNKNSTEMVILNTPQKGTYQIRVKGTSITQGGKQGYAMVATGGLIGLQTLGN